MSTVNVLPMISSDHIYTDGSCLGNPGPGGWAAKCDEFEISGGAHHTTNNVMEMTAVMEALKHSHAQEITIYTDSSYVKNGMSAWIHNWKKKGWLNAKGEPIKNKELWENMDRLSQRFLKINWVWVRAHVGNPMNEYVDQLAKANALKFSKYRV